MYAVLPVPGVAVGVPAEDYPPQVVTLGGEERRDLCRRPPGNGDMRSLNRGIKSCEPFFGSGIFVLSFFLVSMEIDALMFRVSFVQMLLVGTGFTEQTEEQYFQFLSKFEIALPVASNRCLLQTTLLRL